MSSRLVVYVGPTVSTHAVKQVLPDALVLPPIRRGNLYRDRLLGFTTFLILDGVFFERLAISPREVVDVVQDGGRVFGASSMGAIRAAECWPAGMVGIGSIYRLYRRGSLASDDEVAVAFSPRTPFEATTMPLVNVRFAARQATRAGLLPRPHAEQLIRAAAGLHFSDREWQAILDAAQVDDPDQRLASFFHAHDLKRRDALRALTVMAARVDIDGVARPARSRLSRVLADREPREAPTYRFDSRTRVEFGDIWRWIIASGIYRRYASTVGISAPLHSRAANDTRDVDDEAEACAHATDEANLPLTIDRDALARTLQRSRSTPLVLHAMIDDPSHALHVWAAMAAAGDTQAVVLRFIALSRAAAWARQQSIVPGAAHVQLAQAEMADNHGFRSWSDLQCALQDDSSIWATVSAACVELALAKRIREDLFAPGAAVPNSAFASAAPGPS
jgi:hypothetical protein